MRTAWQQAADLLAAGELTLLSVWGEAGRVHMALLQDAAPTDRRAESRMRRQPLSVGRPHPSRRPSGWNARCAICSARTGGAARHAALARPRTLGRRAAAGLRVPAGRGRKPAPDPGRPGACRHHRAGPFPLHRRRRDRGAAGAAARLCAQGDRRVVAWRTRCRAPCASPAARRAIPRSPTPSPSRRAVEAALGIDVPPRGVALRGVMAELERIANHLGDFGAICNDASFSIMLAHCGVLREQVLRCADACFGHRLMMDRIVPGGVAADLERRRRSRAIRALVDDAARPASPALVDAVRRNRVAAGPHRRHRHPASGAGAAVRCRRLCRPRLRPRFRCASGPRLCALRHAALRRAGAAGRRRQCPRLDPHPRNRAEPVDRWSNCWKRCQPAPVRASVEDASSGPGEGMALVEAFRGDVLVWLRVARLAASSAAICATHPGSSGRCWKRRSRATSSPTFRSATKASIVPIRGTICDGGDAMLKTLLQGLRTPLTEPRPAADPELAALARHAGPGGAAQARPQPVRSAQWMPDRATAASWKSMR